MQLFPFLNRVYYEDMGEVVVDEKRILNKNSADSRGGLLLKNL